MSNELHKVFMTTQNCMEQEDVSSEAISAFWRMAEKVFAGQKSMIEAIDEYYKVVGNEEAEKVSTALSKVYSSN